MSSRLTEARVLKWESQIEKATALIQAIEQQVSGVLVNAKGGRYYDLVGLKRELKKTVGQLFTLELEVGLVVAGERRRKSVKS